MLRITAVFAVCLAATACSTRAPIALTASTSAALSGDTARPARAQGWIRSELYFGVDRDGTSDAQVSTQRWGEFLDREVTPRFPDGLTVFDAYGQWLTRGQPAPGRLKSKLLVILHPDTPAHRDAIDAIRRAWKRDTGDQSVLWSWQPADVSF